MDAEDDGYLWDDWPKLLDGTDYDGKQLLTLLRNGNSPFRGAWDVEVLIREIEETLGAEVTDIPVVTRGSNNYGLHIKLSNRPDIVARLARADVNMPKYDSFSVPFLTGETKFEAAAYELLSSEPNILAARMLYHRIPVQHAGPKISPPPDITGRRLFLFERTEGENNIWRSLGPKEKDCLLSQSARIRASLFNFNPPTSFSETWFLQRLFQEKPQSLPFPIAPTRDFCVGLFTSKIEATIGNAGDMIGWWEDNFTVGPRAAAAKQSLLRLIPHIMPRDGDQASLYRLVLDHWDFGIHNMSIAIDTNGQPRVTSIYDWETGCIMPAILSDPSMAVCSVDLVTDGTAAPLITRLEGNETPDELAQYMAWARHYCEILFDQAPDYKRAIQAGKDARHIWFALRKWRDEKPEEYFGDLGDWAETRLTELGVK